MATAGDLTVLDRGGGNSFRIDHADATFSTAISTPGAFSAIVTDREARKWAATGMNWIGSQWIRYVRRDVPDWGGVITSMRWSPGQVEIAAETFHVLLRKRRVNRNYEQQRATAGALARRAYNDVQADDPTLIQNFDCDETGEPIDYQWRGGDLYDDVIRELADASGQEHDVDADRNFIWRVRLGADKSGTVCLSYPQEIVNYEYDGDLWTVENDIEGKASDDQFTNAAYGQVDDDASIKFRGRYMSSKKYPLATNKGALRAKLLSDLRRLRNPAEVLSVDTINKAHSWGAYELGDTILVVLPGPDKRLTARIMARSIDESSQIETLGLVVVT